MLKKNNVAFIIIAAVFLLFDTYAATAQYHYQFNPQCDEAYEAFMALEMDKGRRIIAAERKADPYNLIPIFIANYEDFFTLLFNGNTKDYQRMKPLMEERLSLLEKGDPASPWYNYCKATVYFQMAVIHLRFNEMLSGAYDFRKSYLQLKENKKRFPGFEYNYILLGLEEALIGTVPDSYKWITKILGMQGKVRTGTNEVASFLSNKENTHLRMEAIAYYCYLRFYLLSDKTGTWKYINVQGLDTKNNMVFVYMQAAFALDNNKADLAERTLQNRNQDDDILEVPLFDYLSGMALLEQMDNQAVYYFKRFISNYSGKYFLKAAYQKISYYYLCKGNTAQAKVYKDNILRVGTAITDEDKQAQRYAEKPGYPNVILLRARLYCDGGYFTQALAEMDKTLPSKLPAHADLLEYYYRYGKIYALMNNHLGAAPFYEKAIELGKNSPEQFAARAAFDLGRMYEQDGNATKAASYYRLCLSMKNHDFKSSLDQKAKSGLNRLGM